MMVSYREIGPEPMLCYRWRLKRVDGVTQGSLHGHDGRVAATVSQKNGDADFTCRCAGEEIALPTLSSAFLWCEDNLYRTLP